MHLCFSIYYSFSSHRHKYNLNPSKKKKRKKISGIFRETQTHSIHLWPKTRFDVKWWNLLSADWLASLWRHRKEAGLYQLTHSFTMFTLRSASLIAGLIHSLLHSHILYTSSTPGHILSLSAIPYTFYANINWWMKLSLFYLLFLRWKLFWAVRTKPHVFFFFSIWI